MHKLLCLLVCYSVAVSFAQQTLFEQFTRQDGLLDDTVYDILLGTDGNIWLATAGGVSRFNGLDFQSYGPNEGLDGTEVLGMHRDPNGLTWCFTSAANVYHYAPESERFQGIAANPALATLAGGNIINDLHVDAAGNAWISTVIGGALYRVASGSNQPEAVAVDSFAGTFYARELDDNGIIAGSQQSEQGKDRVRLVLNDTTFEVILSGGDRYTRSSALLLQDGSFLYAKNSEIVHFDRFGVRARLFVEKSVQHLLQDSEQKVWISLYQGGVKCYPQGIGFPNNVIEYLGTRSVAGIAEDGSGNIWFATLGDGVYYMPLRPQLEYASPSIFSTTDPDQVEQVTQPVILEQELLSSGIAQPSGIRAFSPFVDSLPPMIFISGMLLDGRDTTTHDQYTLPHNFKSVRINYVGFASQRGDTMQYKYRMTGLDEEWVFSSSNFAEYNFLPPGEYAFEVSAMNPAGYWSQQPAVVHFTVEPAFWRTWWFIT
ncbi:MAG: triple tyrosine motif-containing protein, partial [Bacteroidota bacterium]